MQFPLYTTSQIQHLWPKGTVHTSRKAIKEDILKDMEQFELNARKRMFGGDGYLFVRFKFMPVSVVEHCVAESGWVGDTKVKWECPCEECKPWLSRWKHLFAALWGVRRVNELADMNYKAPTVEEWQSHNLDTYIKDAGQTWECLQWEDFIESESSISDNPPSDDPYDIDAYLRGDMINL